MSTGTSPRQEWSDAFETSKTRESDFATMSGIPLKPVYGPDDVEHPGVYPYTRGPYASMYRSKLWTMRMFAGFGTAEDTNWRFKEIIKSGGDGLSTAFETTLVALVCALIVQLLLSFIQGLEAQFLDDCNDYCHSNIVSKLKLAES
jgi:hypothetical protein